MKKPRKNNDNKFICEECGKTYIRFCNLSRHIGLDHNQDQYYEKFLKEENEDICPICGKNNPYLERWDRGYKKTCSKKCANILRKQLGEKTNLIKYGVKNVQQYKDVYEKQQKHAKYSKNFKNTNIKYRASYELDFLENFYDKFPDIQNGPTVKYKFNRKERIYFPDFYIPSLNLIIEIKNSYLAKHDKSKINAKKKATISNGLNYIMITNKRYNRFNKLAKNLCCF